MWWLVGPSVVPRIRLVGIGLVLVLGVRDCFEAFYGFLVLAGGWQLLAGVLAGVLAAALLLCWQLHCFLGFLSVCLSV